MAMVVVAAVSNSAGAGKPCPGEQCVGARPQDEILLVSVRPLGCSTDATRFAERIHTERLVQTDQTQYQWRTISLDEFLGAIDPTSPTIFFAHGNRVEVNEVHSRGIWAYGRLVACRMDDRPIRFVIFSWPSEEYDGALRDARLKAARTKPAGYQMAWLLDQLPPQAPLGLIGYSFGARVISGATHLLAGGSLGGLRLPAESFPPRLINAVYIAPAFDADWLGSRCYHGRSMDQVDTLLVTYNRKDPAMKFYPFVNPDKRPQAMGFEGPTSLSRDASPRVRLMNVTSQVGRTHDMCAYMSVGGLMRNAWRRLTFYDEGAYDEPPMSVALAPAGR